MSLGADRRGAERLGRIFRTFLAGVLALLPIAVTVFVFAWVAAFIAGYAGPDSFVGRLIIRLGASVGIDVTPGSIAAYLLGLAIILGAVFVLGLFVELGLRSFFSNSVDWLMTRIPLVSNVYGLSKRFVSLVDRTGGEDSLKTMQPVWCFFGGGGGRGRARPDAVTRAGGDRRAFLSRPARAIGAGAIRGRADLCAVNLGQAGGGRCRAADECLCVDGRHPAPVDDARRGEARPRQAEGRQSG